MGKDICKYCGIETPKGKTICPKCEHATMKIGAILQSNNASEDEVKKAYDFFVEEARKNGYRTD